MTDNISEIASLRQHIELQEEAARRGLYAPAIVASHESITARMQRAAEHLLQLIEAGKHDEAIALMNTPAWEVEEASENVEIAPASSHFEPPQPFIFDFPLKEFRVLSHFLDTLWLDLSPLLDVARLCSITSSDSLLATTTLVSRESAENLSSAVMLLAPWN